MIVPAQIDRTDERQENNMVNLLHNIILLYKYRHEHVCRDIESGDPVNEK